MIRARGVLGAWIAFLLGPGVATAALPYAWPDRCTTVDAGSGVHQLQTTSLVQVAGGANPRYEACFRLANYSDRATRLSASIEILAGPDPLDGCVITACPPEGRCNDFRDVCGVNGAEESVYEPGESLGGFCIEFRGPDSLGEEPLRPFIHLREFGPNGGSCIQESASPGGCGLLGIEAIPFVGLVALRKRRLRGSLG